MGELLVLTEASLENEKYRDDEFQLSIDTTSICLFH